MSVLPITFKAAVLERHNEPLAVKDVIFEGPLHPGHVLVKVHYTGICGKQMEEIAGAHPDPYLPHMLGHEGSGVVIAVGESVKNVKPGDHVVMHWMKGPGINAPPPIYTDGKKRINAGWITTFNEMAVVSENRVTAVDKSHDLRLACLLGCAVTTGVGAAVNEAALKPEQSVAVVGCGGVGLNIIQGAAMLGCHSIIAVDKEEKAAERAKLFGATHFIAANDTTIGEVKKISNGQGANAVFVTATAPVAIELAVELGAAPGTVYVVGVPAAGSKVTLDAHALHHRRAVTGSHGGGIQAERDIPAYLDLYKKGKLKLAELIVAEFPLLEIDKAIDVVKSSFHAGRVVVRM